MRSNPQRYASILAKKKIEYRQVQKNILDMEIMDEIACDCLELFLYDAKFTSEMIERDRSFVEKVRDWLKNFIAQLSEAIHSFSNKQSARVLNSVMQQKDNYAAGLALVNSLLEQGAKTVDQAMSQNAEKSENGTNKNTATSDGEKYSLIIKHTDGAIEEISDARNLTDEQAISYLKQAKKGMLKWNSYIPVRKDTPQVIIDTLDGAGETIENLSLVMQVRKAQQSMSSKNKGGKHGNNIRSHSLSAEEIVEIINNLDNPNMIILQTNRYTQNGELLPNNVAVFVDYNNTHEGTAVIEFESSIDTEFIGTESGDTNYHTVVTIFEPDLERYGMPFDYAEELLSNPDNYELQIKRKQPTKSVNGKKHPNTSNELLSNNNISHSETIVNTHSMQDGEINTTKYSFAGGNALTAEKSLLAEAMELEKNGVDSEQIRQSTGLVQFEK